MQEQDSDPHLALTFILCESVFKKREHTDWKLAQVALIVICLYMKHVLDKSIHVYISHEYKAMLMPDDMRSKTQIFSGLGYTHIPTGPPHGLISH